MTGENPSRIVDHKDRHVTNTRWTNLRLATLSENQWNSKIQRNNTSGFKGVSYDKRNGHYYARLTISGKPTRIGTFDTPEAAHAAYCDAARIHYGRFWSAGEIIRGSVE
jgi:hypothetical protein